MFIYLSRFCQRLYLNRPARLVIATFFSVGKILASAGSTLFGLKESLHTYGVPAAGGIALSSSLTVLNIALTTANRAPPIYRKCLKNTLASEEVLSDEQNSASTAPLTHAPTHLFDNTFYQLSLSSKCLYYLFNAFCCLSLPFSALNAYLSALTLIDEMSAAPPNARLAFAYFVTSSSMMSYCTFNLAKMRRNVLRFCASIDHRLQHGHFEITTKTLTATLIGTLFGIIAGIGTSYLGTSKSLLLFPLTQDTSENTREALVMCSVVASVFSSTFAFAFSCYDQIKAYFEPHQLPLHHFKIPLYAKIMTLIDSTSNSMTGFIGITHLLSRYIDEDPNSWHLIVISLLPLLSNIYMNYSLGLIGCQPSLEWLQKKCCGSQPPAEQTTVDVTAPLFDTVITIAPSHQAPKSHQRDFCWNDRKPQEKTRLMPTKASAPQPYCALSPPSP